MIEHLLQPLVCERFKNDARYRDGHLRVITHCPAGTCWGYTHPR